MKTVLSVLCCFALIVILNGCRNGDDGGSSGGPGRWPTVSFYFEEVGTSTDPNNKSQRVVCANADSNVVTTRQTCIWNCAYYQLDKPRYVQLWFDETLVCTDTATSTTTTTTGAPTTTTGTTTQNCTSEVGLVREILKECRLDNPPPY